MLFHNYCLFNQVAITVKSLSLTSTRALFFGAVEVTKSHGELNFFV
jgi:hypothetical protein